MKNEEIADILHEIADFYEIEENPFRARAYDTAANRIETLSEPIEDVAERGELEDIKGIGSSIASKIHEYLETGSMEKYVELQQQHPSDIEALTRVAGLGPKRVDDLYHALGVATLDELESAAQAGRIRDVDGFGPKMEEKILAGIEQARSGQERELLGRVFSRAKELQSWFDENDHFVESEIVGSFRRRQPTVGDLDVLALAENPAAAMDAFCSFADAEDVIEHGSTKSSIVLPGDLQVDLRIVEDESWGAALVYFTGSKDHNIELRNIAIDRDWKLNEYGLFDVSDVAEDESGQHVGDLVAGATEDAVYDALDLDFIHPELRENTGEVDAAKSGSLPSLVTNADVNGDLQCHTDHSDGANTVAEMVDKADDLGHEYLALTDHGPGLDMIDGLSDRDAVDAFIDDVADANADSDVSVYAGMEAEITDDGLQGTEWVDELDIIVAGMHNPTGTPTDDICTALKENPVDVLAHPTNRLLLERDPIDLGLESVMETCAAENVAVEINAQPNRLDLSWRHVKDYRDTVDFVVSTDAHSTHELELLHLGVSQARRGWLTPTHVRNTASKTEFEEMLNE